MKMSFTWLSEVDLAVGVGERGALKTLERLAAAHCSNGAWLAAIERAGGDSQGY
jgi:hypothetical protein